jgi:hypothetical protein
MPVRDALSSWNTRDVKFYSFRTPEMLTNELFGLFNILSYLHLCDQSFSFFFLRTANAASQTRVIGLLELRSGSS